MGLKERLLLAFLVRRIKRALKRRKLRRAYERGETPDVIEIERQAEMNYQQIEGIVRHVLTTAAGWAVGAGYMTENEAVSIVGGLVAVGAVVWSYLAKQPKSE